MSKTMLQKHWEGEMAVRSAREPKVTLEVVLG